MPTRYLEQQTSKSHQFWIICSDRESLHIRQGKLGTVGKEQIKQFPNHQVCLAHAETLIQSQLAKGYREIDLTQDSPLSQLSVATCHSILASVDLPISFWLYAAQFPDRGVQSAVADHPQVPTVALERLAQSPYSDIAQLVTLLTCENSQTCQERQAAIVYQIKALQFAPKRKAVLDLASLDVLPQILLQTLDLDLRIAIAKHSQTGPSLLAQLTEDVHENVRKEVARHPQTPAAALTLLAGDRSVEVRLTLARNANAPAAALNQLAEDVYEKVRKTVLNHPCLPGEAIYKLRKLKSYDSISWLAKAAQDITMPPEILAKMASPKNHHWVRINVAENPNTALETLEKLSADNYANVRRSLATHPQLTPEILLKILTYTHPAEEVVRQATYGKRIHKKVIVFTFEKQEYTIEEPFFVEDDMALANAAKHPNLPLEIVNKLLEKLDEISRLQQGTAIVLGVVSNPKISSAQLEALAVKAYPHFLQESCYQKLLDNYCDAQGKSNASGYAEYRQKLMQDTRMRDSCYKSANSDVKKLYWAIAQHLNVTEELRLELLERLVKPIEGELLLEQGTIHEMVYHPDIPDEILERMARVKCPYTYQHLAKRHNLPSSVLLKLAKSENRDVITDLAQHPQTPANLLEDFAKLPIGSSRINGSRPRSILHENIARHPNTPSHILQNLAQSTDELVRAAVASNPNVPLHLLTQLAEDRTITGVYLRDQGMIYAGAGCENAVANLAKPYLLICLAVVNNAQTPIPLLKQFAKDSDARIQAAAKARLHQLETSTMPIEPASEAIASGQESEIRAQRLLPFAQSKDLFCRLAVYFDPQAPAALLKLPEGATHWLERYAIAQNPHTPQAVLQQIALDHNPLVRAVALENRHPASLLTHESQFN
jgi:predicted DNA-binding WGR domain protein